MANDNPKDKADSPSNNTTIKVDSPSNENDISSSIQQESNHQMLPYNFLTPLAISLMTVKFKSPECNVDAIWMYLYNFFLGFGLLIGTISSLVLDVIAMLLIVEFDFLFLIVYTLANLFTAGKCADLKDYFVLPGCDYDNPIPWLFCQSEDGDGDGETETNQTMNGETMDEEKQRKYRIAVVACVGIFIVDVIILVVFGILKPGKK